MGILKRLFGGDRDASKAPLEVKQQLHTGFVATIVHESTPAGSEAFTALCDRWESDLRPQLDTDAKELCESYVEASPPDDIFATFVEPQIRCTKPGWYEVTCTFTWQDAEDPHTVTFYFEDWRGRGSSVDG